MTNNIVPNIMSMTIAEKLAQLSPEKRAALSQNAWSGNAKQSRSAPVHHIGSHRIPRDGSRPADNFSRKQGPSAQSFQQRPKHCGHCARIGENPDGHIASECPVLANTRCQCCGEKGHLRSRCPQNEAFHQYVVPKGAQRPLMVESQPDSFVVPSKNHKKQKSRPIKPKQAKTSGSMFDVLDECNTLKPKVGVPNVVDAPKAEWPIIQNNTDVKLHIIQNNSNYTDDTGDDLEWGKEFSFLDDCSDDEGGDGGTFSWWDKN